MSTTYAHRQTTAQKVADSKAASLFDSSSQSESLQRKANMANNAVVQLAKGDNAFDAGDPKAWHIHYGEHIKFAKETGKQVKFRKGLSKYNTVIENLKTKYDVDDVNVLRNKDADTWDECNTWLQNNLVTG